MRERQSDAEPPPADSAHGTQGIAFERGSRRKRDSCEERATRRQGDTGLSVSAQQFSEESIRGLIDDWLVPSLVEQFLRDKMELSDSSQEGHN